MKIKRASKQTFALLLVIVTMLFSGCDRQATDTSNVFEENNQDFANDYILKDEVISSIENLAGYVEIYGNTLFLDEVRVTIYDFLYPHHSFLRHVGENIVVVSYGDTDKLNELDEDASGDWLGRYPSGFSIELLGNDVVSFELTNETVFTFVDTGFLFLDDSYMNRTYHTRIVDEFLLHRGDSDTMLFVQVQNGRVLSVVEELLFTQ